MAAAQLFNTLGRIGVGVALAGGVINSALYNVEGGHRAVIFDRFAGVKQQVVGEGYTWAVLDSRSTFVRCLAFFSKHRHRHCKSLVAKNRV